MWEEVWVILSSYFLAGSQIYFKLEVLVKTNSFNYASAQNFPPVYNFSVLLAVVP